MIQGNRFRGGDALRILQSYRTWNTLNIVRTTCVRRQLGTQRETGRCHLVLNGDMSSASDPGDILNACRWRHAEPENVNRSRSGDWCISTQSYGRRHQSYTEVARKLQPQHIHHNGCLDRYHTMSLPHVPFEVWPREAVLMLSLEYILAQCSLSTHLKQWHEQNGSHKYGQ